MDPLASALAALFDALARHGRVLTRGDAPPPTAVEVGGHVAHVVSLTARPARLRLDEPPPRPVATAMARALFAAPHLSRTLSVGTTASDNVVFHTSEGLTEALGLPEWQLDELRGEVDQAVTGVLERTRALHWLWQRAGNPRVHPDTLAQLLFPGLDGATVQYFSYRGARLYAVLDEARPPPPEALHLPWLPESARWTAVPDRALDLRYVDPSLLRNLARAVGATPDKVGPTLGAMVCAVPASDVDGFLARDRWRSEGWATLTGLGEAYPGHHDLTAPVAPDDDDLASWLLAGPDGVHLDGARKVFDRHAMTRLTALAHGLYGELCARTLAEVPVEAGTQAVLYDLDPYVQRALQPLLDWAAAPATRSHLARHHGVAEPVVGRALGAVRDDWLRAATSSWGGAPTPDRPYTVQSILAAHLAVLQSSLTRMAKRPQDPRADHRRVLMLFTAAYLRHAPLGRLWRAVDGRLPPVEDVVGAWFWGLWQRVLDVAVLDE